ncbi:PREDICTED: uncharacterized protein DDB_G0290587-like, partial [Rhagoletis zephyria]|uniref:uncharacterized protein DDB_G0290587-like n=1 Tax=Rhagoletis zephyria TaxID=28612 RepID=UPI00081134F7
LLLLTPTSTTPTTPTTASTRLPVEAPATSTPPVELRLAVTTAPQIEEVASSHQQAATAGVKQGEVLEEILPVEAELVSAQKAAATGDNSTSDIAPVVVAPQQCTTQQNTTVATAAVPTTTPTPTPTATHTATSSPLTNGNNNSLRRKNGNFKESPKDDVTTTALTKGLSNHYTLGRSSKPKVNLKMRFKVAKRICQRRLRPKAVDENYPQPQRKLEDNNKNNDYHHKQVKSDDWRLSGSDDFNEFGDDDDEGDKDECDKAVEGKVKSELGIKRA